MDTLKESINMRDLVGRYMGVKAKASAKNYDVYPCPIHREQKGSSFVVYDTHCQCMGKCGKSWDCYAFLMELYGLTFAEAKQRLGGEVINQPRQPIQAPKPTIAQAPDEAWQSKAWQVVATAKETLWSDKGKRARDYLYARGLRDEWMQRFSLGYVPGAPDAWVKFDDLSVPCGIVIPHIFHEVSEQGDASQIWGIKVRRAAGAIRYQQVGGGNIKGHLYLASEVKPGKPLLIDEGEFNAMVINQSECGVCAIALGSTGNMDINSRWFGLLAAAPVILARMDEGSGDKALAHLRRFSRAVRPVQVPSPHKDPNEYYLAQGDFGMWAWLNGGEWTA